MVTPRYNFCQILSDRSAAVDPDIVEFVGRIPLIVRQERTLKQRGGHSPFVPSSSNATIPIMTWYFNDSIANWVGTGCLGSSLHSDDFSFSCGTGSVFCRAWTGYGASGGASSGSRSDRHSAGCLEFSGQLIVFAARRSVLAIAVEY